MGLDIHMYWTGPDPRPWNDVEDEDEDKPGDEETFGTEDGEEGVSNGGGEVGLFQSIK